MKEVNLGLIISILCSFCNFLDIPSSGYVLSLYIAIIIMILIIKRYRHMKKYCYSFSNLIWKYVCLFNKYFVYIMYITYIINHHYGNSFGNSLISNLKSFWTSSILTLSSGEETKEMAIPFVNYLPALPTLCIYISLVSGISKLITILTL